MEDKSMKGLLFAIAAFCIISLSCSFSSQNRVALKNNNDTVVCSELLFDIPFEEREYFVVIGTDTSAYSCAINSEKGKCGTMKLYFTVNDKYYTCNEYSDEKDTTIGSKIRIESEREFYIPCYEKMLREIDLCIEAASKDKDVTTLTSFSSSLSYLGDIAVLTTNNLLSHFSVRRDGLYYLSDIGKALNMTSFAKDMSKILNKYGIEVEQVSCEERRDNFGKDEFLRHRSISKGINVPDTIINAEVYVSIKKLENVDLE